MVNRKVISGSNPPIYLEYWSIPGAPLKNGLTGIIKVFLLAFFAFGGTEMISLTAGEAKNPSETIPKAIRQTFWRILIFYILSIFIMGLVVRNDDPNLLDSESRNHLAISPFTLVFKRAGLSFASNLMNSVVLSAVLSSSNSALYAASRTIFALSVENKAPEIFKVLRNGVPIYSILITSFLGTISFCGIFLGDGVVFFYLISVTGICGILTWICISLIHVRFRQALVAQGKDVDLVLVHFKSSFYPVGPILAIILSSLVLIGQGYVSYQQSLQHLCFQFGIEFIIIAGVPLFILFFLYSKIMHKTKMVILTEIDLDTILMNGNSSDRSEEEALLTS